MRWFKIEKKELEIVREIIKEANSAVKSQKTKANQDKYYALLVKNDVTIENKKALLLKNLHNLLIKTISIDTKKGKKDKITTILKHNIPLLRNIVMKLRDINYYLETVFLEELGLLKVNIRLLSKKELRKLQNKDEGYINRKELSKLEQTVYSLIEKLIFSDKKLLENYTKKEIKVEAEKEVGIWHLEPILKKESELLCHLEAKLPPAKHIKKELLNSKNYTPWITTLLALLSAFESYYQKEIKIFKKLRQKEKLRKKLNVKIKHLLKEKERLLRLKDERIKSAKNVAKLEKDWFKATHHYTTALRL